MALSIGTVWREALEVVFTRYYVYLDHPEAELERVLLSASSRWLSRLDGAAGDELLARVGVRLAGVPIYKAVAIELGQPRFMESGSRLVVPIAWRTSGGPPLFPEMEGEIELEAVGAERTQLTLSASYRPPLGRLGEAIGRGLLRRLADATIADFVTRLGAALGSRVEARTSAGAPGRA